MSHLKSRSRQRSGVACVELAACLPIMGLVVFSSLMVCDHLLSKQTVERLAYDLCREIELQRATTMEITSRAQTLLKSKALSGAATVSEVNLPGELRQVTVQIRAATRFGRLYQAGINLASVEGSASLVCQRE